jgi:quinol-cytochrome oxidoreductase complex cytochrome b subunit
MKHLTFESKNNNNPKKPSYKLLILFYISYSITLSDYYINPPQKPHEILSAITICSLSAFLIALTIDFIYKHKAWKKSK